MDTNLSSFNFHLDKSTLNALEVAANIKNVSVEKAAEEVLNQYAQRYLDQQQRVDKLVKRIVDTPEDYK
jgi:hypothetical protein